MFFKKTHLLLIAVPFAMIACGGSGNQKPSATSSEYTSSLPENASVNPITIDGGVDLSGNIDEMSLQNLRLLRSSIHARHGYMFMEADLRGYFSTYMPKYDSLMWALWEDTGMKDEPTDVKLTDEERELTDKIDRLMAQRLKENYVDRNGFRLGNEQNIINLFQFKDISREFTEKLSQNNFVITEGGNQQLFHVYETNDYGQIPSFITTDLFLQAFHMYFSYVLKSLEQKKFMPVIEDLCLSLYESSMKRADDADNQIKEMSRYSATFYAIPYYLLTGKKQDIPAEYRKKFEEEITQIKKEEDAASDFLSFEAGFPYSLFKPRGHYTRKPETERYFRAMMWLQMAPYCRNNDLQLREAIYAAVMLNAEKTANGVSLKESYRSVFEPIAFLVGQPDNLSIMDISNYLEKEGVHTLEKALSPEVVAKTDKMLQSLALQRNVIKPEIELSCRDKINFMPQRYLADNEVLQTMADVRINAEKAFPKGLEVFAAFGSQTASDILRIFEQEDKKWDQYTERMDKMSNKFRDFDQWNASVYNKWIESLMAMQQKDKSYPPFMQTPSWDRKNLNTSLASWAELKHDAILYGEQPMAAECGGGDSPPPPIVVGYVEPNLRFWTKLSELVDLTDKMLTDHRLMTDDLKSKTEKLREFATFLTNAARKELKGEKLSDGEYQSIAYMGSSVEWFTLSVIDPDLYLDSWDLVEGPDKSVAVVADIYTRNVPGCPKNGILHVATGNVNEIYVTVEIGGYLYLTKGAAFSYYEFVEPDTNRLTDEEWQKRLEKNRQPKIPQWMEDIIIRSDKKPDADERVFYGSGC